MRNRICTSDKYNQVSCDSRSLGEINDCAVKMVALVADIPYAEAHRLLAAKGRRSRKGTYPYQYMEVLRELGKRLVPVSAGYMIAQYPGNQKSYPFRGITTHHPRRFAKAWKNGKTYIFRTQRHVLAVKDGEVLDWTINNSLQVKEIYEVL